MTLQSFQKIGEYLFAAGLNNSHSGNLSIKDGDNMIITASGAMLHQLSNSSLIRTSLGHNDQNQHLASSEYPVHRAVYQHTNAGAVVHAHCPYLVAESFFANQITPMDAEGLHYFPEGIPVVQVKNPIASEEVALSASNFLGKYAAMVVRGHGVFAVGETLSHAYQTISSLEHSAKIGFLYKTNLKLSLDKEL